jgi:cell division protein FtsL
MRSLVGILIVLVTASAIAVVYMRHQHRLSYVALQSAQQERDDLNIEWGQLLLEQSTWAMHRRVEAEANRKLGMVTPNPDQIMVIGK